MSEDTRDPASVLDGLVQTLEGALGNRAGPVGIAVSGGRDSMVLLEAASRARGRLPCLEAPVVLHLDHTLRADSAADRRLVEARALALGLEARSERRDVAALHRARGGSLEDVARSARYAFFERHARELGLLAVLTAHHADDRVETVAMQLMRGTPAVGLVGIPRTRRLSRATDTLVLRPLLDVSRAALEAAARAWRVPWRDDVTNADLRHRRNLVRHVLLPVGAARYDLVHRLGVLGERAVAVSARITRIAAALERELGVTVSDDEAGRCCSVPRAPLGALPVEVVRCLLDRMTARCHPALGRLGARAVAHILEAGAGDVIELARDLHVDVVDGDDGEHVVIRRTVTRDAPPEWNPLPLRPGSAARVAVTGQVVRASFVDDGEPTHSPFEQWLDPRAVRGAMVVRAPRHGERIRPFGLGGSKLVSDLLAEAGVPAIERWARPVIADDEGILWIPGVRAAERCRVTRRGRLLRLSITGAAP